jgi:hypothetical protein
MSKPYDATIKDLAAVGPADFVSWFDGPTNQTVTVLNVDLSTVTTAADVVFGIGDPMTEILHLDAQAGASATKHLDVLAYNVLLHRQYGVPVHSCVLLLRSQAEHPNMTGLRLKSPDEVRQLFQGASIAMRESVTFQAILEEGEQTGRIKELHRMILRQGRVRFGEADEAVRQQIEAMRDIERLEDLSERLLFVSNWDELMA